MIYSKIYLQQKQTLPKIIIFFTFIFSTISFLLIFFKKSIPSKASKNIISRLEITNLTPIQAAVFWQTNERQICLINYGENKNNLKKIVFDERDIEKEKKPYLNHYSILKDLKPNKDYYFIIICENQKITNKNGEYFSFRTPMSYNNLNKFSPISGKILKENLSLVSNGIVLLNISDRKLFSLSYLLKNSGEWIISLNSFYNKDDYKEEILREDDKAIIEVFTEDDKRTRIVGSLKKLLEKNHTFILGKEYNLLNEENVLSAVDKINNIDLNNKTFKVLYPQEGALIPGKKPLIKGLGTPFSLVLSTINGKNNKIYSFNTYVDKNGFWNYAFPENLDLGRYSATFIGKDDNNKEIKILRNFIITGNDAFEGKILGTASEEPNIQPTYKLITPFISPTKVITDYINKNISTRPSLPVSGSVNFLSIIISFSFILTGIGIFIIFLK